MPILFYRLFVRLFVRLSVRLFVRAVFCTLLLLPTALPVAADTDAFPEHFTLELVWTKDLGSGYSRIAVADGKVVTAFSSDKDDFLVALAAADGAELWRYRIAEAYRGHDGSDDGPLSSPVVAEGVVYGLGPLGHLFALRLADGAPIWETKLSADIARTPEYGFTTTPLPAGDLLIVETGGEKSAVTAFDRATGARRWTALEGKVAYESPALVDLGGRTQIVAVTDRHVVGLNPKDGGVLWSHPYSEGERDGFAQPIAIGEGRLLFATWSEAVLLDLRGEKPVEAWRSRELAKSYVLPMPHEGHLYGYNGAFLTAVDLATGALAWKSRPPGRSRAILVDGHLVILVESGGEVVVAEANPTEYREKARIKALDAGYFTAPTWADGKIYVRNLKQIAALRVSAPPAESQTGKKESSP